MPGDATGAVAGEDASPGVAGGRGLVGGTTVGAPPCSLGKNCNPISHLVNAPPGPNRCGGNKGFRPPPGPLPSPNCDIGFPPPTKPNVWFDVPGGSTGGDAPGPSSMSVPNRPPPNPTSVPPPGGGAIIGGGAIPWPPGLVIPSGATGMREPPSMGGATGMPIGLLVFTPVCGLGIFGGPARLSGPVAPMPGVCGLRFGGRPLCEVAPIGRPNPVGL